MPKYLSQIAQKVRDTIHTESLIESGDKILVAISGGPDSVFLAYILRELRYKIALVHINYQLRGEESEADEALVRKYAKKWEVPVFIKKIDTPALLKETSTSMQALARDIRYNFFESVMDKHGFHHCAIAHHADDQVENLLMSLFHGNSSQIWKGMPVKRERYIRPLMGLTQQEIMEGIEAAELEWRLDRSNLKTDYLRNRYRHQIVPVLEEIQLDVKQKLLEKERWYVLQHQFIAEQIAPWMQKSLVKIEGGEALNWEAFEEKYGAEYVPLLLSSVLGKWGLHGHLLWECMRLQHSLTGKWVDTPQGKVVKSRNGLILTKFQEGENECLEVVIFEGEKVVSISHRELVFRLPEINTPDFSRKDVFYLDADKLEWPLTIRTWQEGDRMRPLGMKNTKKLSDIFIDEKFSPIQKQQAIIIEDKKEIVCLSEFRIAEKGKVRKNSERILSIQILAI